MRLFNTLTVLFTLLPSLLLAAPTPPPDAPLANSNITAHAGDVIPDSYVVMLKPGTSREQFEAHQQWAMAKLTSRMQKRSSDPSSDHHYGGIQSSFDLDGLYGYTGSFDNSTMDDINHSDEVDLVEPDQVVVAYDTVQQMNPPSWGLSHISSPLDADTTDAYAYDTSAGRGVNVYVLDTGINTQHVDFGGRAQWGTNIAGGANADNQGHGTHVAGTIGGSKFGVAKGANLIAVKVLGDGGSGSTSRLVQGIEWVIAHASSRGNSPSKSVVNMSLGGAYSAATNRAVEAAVARGLTFVVAAGNDGKPADQYSPASSPAAITVGATGPGNVRTAFSNYGPAVDIFAPGSNIVSAWIPGRNDVNTLSGTSMASPHVAGIAATLISKEGLSGAQSVRGRIMQLGKKGVVGNAGKGSRNLLAWNGV